MSAERNTSAVPSTFTYEQVQELLRSVVEAANKPNVLEQRALDSEMEREKRRAMLAVELGRAEMQARWDRQNGCSHSANPTTGESVPRGSGKWLTGGQMHGDGNASLVCMRCATIWRFTPTPAELNYIENSAGGLMGFAPPALERCVNREDFVTKRPA